MSVQSFLHTIDGISTWVGKATAWLMIVLMSVVCLRTGEWPSRLKDVAEIDVIEEQLAHSEYVDEESRKIAIEGAARIDEMARQRGMGGEMNT